MADRTKHSVDRYWEVMGGMGSGFQLGPVLTASFGHLSLGEANVPLQITAKLCQLEQSSMTTRIVHDLHYSFGALVKAVRLFTASFYNQPMCFKCALLTFCQSPTVWLQFERGTFRPPVCGLRETCWPG